MRSSGPERYGRRTAAPDVGTAARLSRKGVSSTDTPDEREQTSEFRGFDPRTELPATPYRKNRPPASLRPSSGTVEEKCLPLLTRVSMAKE